MTSTTADVAQLVESQIVILVVAGSSPVVRLTKFCKSKLPILIEELFYWDFFILALRADSAAALDILTASAAASVARFVAAVASVAAFMDDSSA